MAPEIKSTFEPHIGRSVSLDHAAELLGVSGVLATVACGLYTTGFAKTV